MAFPNALALEQKESPRVTESVDYIDVTRIYQIPHLLTDAQRVRGEYIPDSDYIDPEFSAKYFGNTLIPGAGYDVIEIHFRKRNFPQAQYDCHTSSYECPIEQDLLGTFVMKWKYNLFYSDAGATPIPTWGSADAPPTGAVDFSNTIGTNWVWSTADYIAGKFLRQQATKPGVNTFLRQTTMITKRKVYETKADARQWIKEVGYLCAPVETYGLAIENEYWLIRDARLVEDQDSYAVTVEFLFSDFGWDTDIYSDASIDDDGF